MVKTMTIVYLLMIILSAPTTLLAENKVFERQVDQPFAGNQSPQDAYVAAVARAKSEVLDMAGTYIESLSVVKNSVLTQDEAVALAAGILKTEVIERKNYATSKTFGLILRTKIEVDTSILQQRVAKLINDRTLLRKYNELQQRERELLARINKLEQQNHAQTGALSQRQAGIQFAQLSAALTASQWHKKAIELWSNGSYSDPNKAIEFINQALALDPDNNTLYNARAVAKLNLNQYDAAIKDLSHALTIAPNYADAHNNLGSLYFKRHKYQQAITEYSKAINQQPDFVEAIINRAMAARKLLHYEAALKDFRRAATLTPKTAQTTQHAGSRVHLDDIAQLCSKAQTACDMGLCRALNFLNQRGFCQQQNTSATATTSASH
ncbi:MAG: hypothetical protein B6I36_06250 [Desulfobacteraceae bacterium 4572_35.1]|nr:MAG: hypothetical protein B6I36_06250 [Desulfobacteraceae bacterium 4572_35.1]